MKQNSVETGLINASAAAWIPPTTTFASPPGAPVTGSVYVFTDALYPGAAIGGGSSLSTCRWSGAAWIPFGTAPTSVFGVTIDGGGFAISTGQKGYVQLPYACTITGWSCIADLSGSISVDVDAHASSAPNAAPTVPNTTTDKISASAPIALSSAQTASGGTSQVSTWTTSRAQWDVFGFNVTSATTVTRVTVMVTVTRS